VVLVLSAIFITIAADLRPAASVRAASLQHSPNIAHAAVFYPPA
jgi:hypothetical protein